MVCCKSELDNKVPAPNDQVDIVIRLLRSKKVPQTSPVFNQALKWLRVETIPQAKRDELISTICTAFEITKAGLLRELSGVTQEIQETKWKSPEAALLSKLPKGGWLEWYAEYTKQSEAPLAFHLFSFLCTIGAALGRRCYVDQEFFKIYPNYATVLIGPTGKVRKTTAANIAKKFVEEEQLCPITADKVTPERFVADLQANGQHFLYAPELAVFFGRQRYNEGLSTLIIRLLDSPDTFTVHTITREENVLTEVALTVLACSTPSLLTESTPNEVASSGFLNRFMVIVEEDTDRCFPFPKRGDPRNEIKLKKMLRYLLGLKGALGLNKEARQWFDTWYRERRRALREVNDELLLELMERVPDHLLRTAMLIHLTHCEGFEICVRCLQTAKVLVDYATSTVPRIVNTIMKTKVGKDTEYIMRVLRRMGGAAPHSDLLRRCGKTDAVTFKRAIGTLKEQGVVREEKQAGMRYYVIEEEA